eukprot:763817-Hanusia_phi.AAC.2
MHRMINMGIRHRGSRRVRSKKINIRIDSGKTSSEGSGMREGEAWEAVTGYSQSSIQGGLQDRKEVCGDARIRQLISM